MTPKNFIDLAGVRFGRLTVVDRAENLKDWKTAWNCKCECGNEKVIRGSDLKNGKTTSCGCYMNERRIARSITHCMSKTRQYKIWRGIKERCNNSNNPSYKYYGGRGIKICSEWVDSFENFWDDMKESYSESLSIDRIDVNGNYEKLNCRWATDKEQANNTTLNRNVEYMGKTHTIMEWSALVSIHFNTLRKRLNYGWSVEEAFTRKPANNTKYLRQAK